MLGSVEVRRRAAASLWVLAMGHVGRENDVLNIGHQICVYNEVPRFCPVSGMGD